jgi:hypothetical protein
MTLNSDFFHGSGYRPLTAQEQVATSGYDRYLGGGGPFEYYVIVPSAEAHFFDFSQSREENSLVFAKGYSAVYGINYLYPIEIGPPIQEVNPWEDIEFFEISGVYLSYPSNYTTQVRDDAEQLRISPKDIDTTARMSDSIVGADGLDSNFSNASKSVPNNIIDNFTAFAGYIHYMRDHKNMPIELNYKDLLYQVNEEPYNSYVGNLKNKKNFSSSDEYLGMSNHNFRADLAGSGWFLNRQPWGPPPPPPPEDPNTSKNPLLEVDPCPGSIERDGTGGTIEVDKGKTKAILYRLYGKLRASDIIAVYPTNNTIFTVSHTIDEENVVPGGEFGGNLLIVVTGKASGSAEIQISYTSTCGKDENAIESYYKNFPNWTGDTFLSKVEVTPVRVIDQPGDEEEDGEENGACTTYATALLRGESGLAKVGVGKRLETYSLIPFIESIKSVASSSIGLTLEDWGEAGQGGQPSYCFDCGGGLGGGGTFVKGKMWKVVWKVRGVTAGTYQVDFTVAAYCYDKSKKGTTNNLLDEKSARIKNSDGSYKTVEKIYTNSVVVE